MHRIHFILQVLLLALAAGAQDLFELACLDSDLLENSDYNISTCLQKPYCPGYDVSEDLQRYLFTQFTQTLYGEKNVSKAFETYVSSNITEHDPDDAQNRDAIVARLSQIIPYANFTILRSSFDNDTGLIHLRFEQNPEPVALADIYRMDGTCIVEHWDVSQARPANSTNPIAMF
jgi:predicted SnoaL-like aldol condensation-catalyzing enzyme